MNAPKHAAAQHDVTPCVVKQLPDRLRLEGVKTALAINPLNGVSASLTPNGDGPVKPLRLTARIAKRWDNKPRTLSVSFMEDTPRELQDRIISHLNAWKKTCCIDFKRVDKGIGEVRIAFGPGGYWSYLGTDILLIPEEEPTMNLENFSMATSEDEYKRVVRHEAGHTLGFEHEHMRRELVDRIDKKKAYRYFLLNQGWDEQTVDQQVLTPLDKKSIMGTPADETSIMCYQLPGEIMKDGIGIPGGEDINESDYEFAGDFYPKPTLRAAGMLGAVAAHSNASKEWPASKDIVFSAALIEKFNEATLSH